MKTGLRTTLLTALTCHTSSFRSSPCVRTLAASPYIKIDRMRTEYNLSFKDMGSTLLCHTLLESRENASAADPILALISTAALQVVSNIAPRYLNLFTISTTGALESSSFPLTLLRILFLSWGFVFFHSPCSCPPPLPQGCRRRPPHRRAHPAPRVVKHEFP